MKIFMNKKVYVSKKDVRFLVDLGARIPIELNDILLAKDDEYLYDEKSDDEFIELCDEMSVEYFKDIPFIVNYGEYKNLDVEEIRNIACETTVQKNLLEKYYNNLTDEEKEKNYFMSFRIKYLINILIGLIDIIQYKDGSLMLDLPKRQKPSPYDKYPTFIDNVFTKRI
ncbi:MAG: hypothetical protein IJ565_05690 [Bacilli bacterium]|nr:hypothetical protein [Bacilli bacterium]